MYKAIAFFVISSIVLVGMMIKYNNVPGFIEISVYVITFYALVVLVVAIVIQGVPAIIKFCEGLPIVGRLITNIRYRQRFFLYMGGLGNTLFLLFYFVVAFYYQSRWFYVIGLYNLCIAIMRGYLSNQEHRLQIFTDDDMRPIKESIVTRNVAFMLFIMNAIISIMGLLIIFKDDTFKYHFIILYGLALYVFIRLIVIIVAIIQSKPHNTGIWKVVQLINLATATVSLFTFQTALLYNYEESVIARERYNAITGFVIILINLGIVVRLMVYSYRLKNQAVLEQ
ncbi:MAG: hypothetical protein K6F66_08135 [Pseudobutyrivibrio sp.]|nr:hypothetical protein [Pseudobutyrivibrio sp.]